MNEWKAAAMEQSLYPTRITFIQTTPRKAPKRVLMEFSSNIRNEETTEETLILEVEPGTYSDDAKKLLGDFYLKL
jgi:tRNA1Val (adenine37-N6)-methyltransferase